MRPSAGELARRILALAAPTTVLSAIQVAALLVETWIAARLGREALAGWAVVLPFALLLGQMSAGAMGGGVPYAIALFGLGAVPVWLANTLASILRGAGRHALAARVLNLAWAAYPALGFLLAEPLGLGLTGLGLAFALCFWAAAGVLARVAFSGAAGFVPALRAPWRLALFRRILAVGAVACALALIANLATILVTARLSVHGPAAVAAFGVSARLEFMMIPLAFGVGSALTALAGRAVGQGDWETARRTAWVGGGMAFALCAAIGLVIGLFPAPFAALFSSDAEVAALAERALSFIAPAFGGFGLGMAMYFAAMGAGRMAWPVAAGVARLAIAVGGGWLLGDLLGMGMDGQFLAVALGITAYGALAAAAVRPGVWGPRVSP